MRLHLHPGARWLFRMNAYVPLIIILFFLSPIMGFISIEMGFVSVALSGWEILSNWLILPIVVYPLLIIVLGEIYARMTYTRWFYEFAQTNLKIERGIIWKKYSNIPYERVQNVDILRGIIARICGFSSVNIQTAGYSGGSGTTAWSEGYIPAVSKEEAEKIREFLMKKISKKSRSGL